LLSKTRLVLLTCAVAALVVAALAGTAGARGSTIKLGDDFFSPTEKTVDAGTKVKFNWIGSDKHNVVKKKGPGGDFASGVLKGSGVLYSHKFKKSGTYKLICTIHDDMKMTLHVN
jgi:plastocyanin